MRYSRQTSFLNSIQNIPENFYSEIRNKKIIVVGCGGVGSLLSQMLVRGGFLNLTLVDNDIIDETNLQRQAYFEENIGEGKAEALRENLLKIDKNANIKIYQLALDENNIKKIAMNCSLIIDATDNFETRRIINDYSEDKGKDWIYNGAVKTEAMSAIFYGNDKMFSKVFPKNAANISCCEVGVLSSTTSLSASLAYNMVLKYFLGIKENKLVKINLWNYKIYEIEIK